MPSAERRTALAVLMASAALAGAAWLAACSPREHHGPPAPPPVQAAKVDQDILDGAFEECFRGDCERAYAHLEGIAVDSPVMKSPAYHAVVYRHDAERLLRADVEPDLVKRREILDAVANSHAADTALRLMAVERISRLGAVTPTSAVEFKVNAVYDAGSTRSLAALAAEELSRMASSKDPAERKEVRAKLEPKVFAGKATREDVALLREVCVAEADVTCQKQLDRLILH